MPPEQIEELADEVAQLGLATLQRFLAAISFSTFDPENELPKAAPHQSQASDHSIPAG